MEASVATKLKAKVARRKSKHTYTVLDFIESFDSYAEADRFFSQEYARMKPILDELKFIEENIRRMETFSVVRRYD